MLTGNTPSRTLRPLISNAPARRRCADRGQILGEVVAIVLGVEANEIVITEPTENLRVTRQRAYDV